MRTWIPLSGLQAITILAVGLLLPSSAHADATADAMRAAAKTHGPSVVRVQLTSTLTLERLPGVGKGARRTHEISIPGVVVDSKGLVVFPARSLDPAAGAFALLGGRASADVLSVRVVGSDGQIREAKWLGTDPKSQLAFVRIGSVGQKGLAPIAWTTTTAALGDPLLVVSLTPSALGNTVRVDRSRVAFADAKALGLTPQHPHALGALVVSQAGKPLGLLAHHLPTPGSGDVLRPDLIALANAGYVVLPPSFKALIANPPKTVGRSAKRRARTWLGIKPQVLTPELAESLALDIDVGVHVASLYDGPAKAAGIQKGDIFLRLDGESLDLDPGESFRDIIEDYPAGSKVSLLVRRTGKIKEFEVELSRSPIRPQDAERARIGEAGLLLRALTFFDRVEIGLAPKSPGAVVLEIDPDGAGSRAGLRVGDIVIKVGGKNLQSLAELRRRLSEPGALPLTVKRHDEELTLRVQH